MTSFTHRLSISGLLILLVACGSSGAGLRSEGDGSDRLLAEEERAATERPATYDEEGEETAPTPTGFIWRHEIDAVLEGGPARILAAVRTQPAFRSSRFLGHRVEAILTRDPRFTPPKLGAGDVILRVNGLPIERPEQFMDAFESLRSAHQVVIDLWRNERRVRLLYPIREEPGSKTAPPARAP